MNIEMLHIEHLIPYENNPRFNDDAVDAVANSIKEFGFKQPIVVDKFNVIIAGHTRAKAAEKLGFQKVPVIRADDLTDEQVRAYRLADNKVSEASEWDFDALEEELNKISEIDMTEFDFEIAEEEMPDFQPVDADTQPVLDELDPIYVHCPECGCEFNARSQI